MTMEAYLKSMTKTIDYLEVIEIKIPEDLIVLFMLHSLPKEYHYFTCAQTGKDFLSSIDEF